MVALIDTKDNFRPGIGETEDNPQSHKRGENPIMLSGTRPGNIQMRLRIEDKETRRQNGKGKKKAVGNKSDRPKGLAASPFNGVVDRVDQENCSGRKEHPIKNRIFTGAPPILPGSGKVDDDDDGEE
jgi:hypothetical protein